MILRRTYIPHDFVLPPIIPIFPPPFRLAMLLKGNDVQLISFRFGHVVVLPSGLREVADALLSSRMKVRVDPTYLASSGSVAEYHSGSNTFIFASDKVLDDTSGRQLCMKPVMQ